MNANSSNSLLVSYHRVSTVDLDPADQDDLGARLEAHGLAVGFKPFVPPGETALPLASIIPEPRKLIVVINGVLSAHPLLREVVEELFVYWDEHWREIKRQKSVEHFAIILDVTVEGRRRYVGIDFKDSSTLAINFYRLQEFVNNPAAMVSTNTLAELEYPKTGIDETVMPAIAVSILLALGLWNYWQTLSGVSVYLPFALGVLGLTLVWGLMFAIPHYKKLRYRSRYRKLAHNWAIKINPQREAPKNTTPSVNIFLDKSQQINQSGEVNLQSASDITVGGDVTGRDKTGSTTP